MLSQVNASASRNNAQTAYQQALRGVRPRWHVLMYLLAGLLGAFVLPAVLLCKIVPLKTILWAITGAMLTTGTGYLATSRNLEKRAFTDRRVDDLLLSGLLMIAATLLFAQVAAQPALLHQRPLPFWPSLAIAVVTVAAGVYLMHRRALRLAGAVADRT